VPSALSSRPSGGTADATLPCRRRISDPASWVFGSAKKDRSGRKQCWDARLPPLRHHDPPTSSRRTEPVQALRPRRCECRSEVPARRARHALSRCHANGAVQPDTLAIEIGVSAHL
jgi:hypothetical protein